jgi:hypothetical protein
MKKTEPLTINNSSLGTREALNIPGKPTEYLLFFVFTKMMIGPSRIQIRVIRLIAMKKYQNMV